MQRDVINDYQCYYNSDDVTSDGQNVTRYTYVSCRVVSCRGVLYFVVKRFKFQ